MTIQTIRRGLIGLAHASVFLWLALPFAGISSCAGPSVKRSGYQLLAGADVHQLASSLGTSTPSLPPDLWVLGPMAVAVVGILMARPGSMLWAWLRMALALAGLVALYMAVAEVRDLFPSDVRGEVEVYGVEGWDAASLAVCGAALLDVGWLVFRAGRRLVLWFVRPDRSRAQRAAAAGVAAAAVAVALSLGVLGWQDTHLQPPHQVTVAELRARPLHVPTAGCPLTAADTTVHPPLYGDDVFGVWSPATLTAGDFNRVTFHMADVPSVVRGAEIGGSVPVLFEPKADQSQALTPRSAGDQRMLLAPELDFTWSGNTVSTVVWVDHPGCYGYQYDGASGSRVVVVRAT